MTSAGPTKKRHHYLPVTYLKNFVGDDQRLRVYRKDQAEKCLLLQPQSIAFRRYYYSQPTPYGEWNHDALENLFSAQEERWPSLVWKLNRREPLSPAEVSDLFGFIALQRVRVPAARDMAEAILAHQVMASARALEAQGLLPPAPPEVPDILGKTVVSIDPHMSIHAMTEMMRALKPAFNAIGLEVLHNATSATFITSDNPVMLFDPAVREKTMRPYVLSPTLRSVELLFPVSPTLCIRGHPLLRSDFGSRGMRYRKLKSVDGVRRINRMTARFAYELLIASDDTHGSLARVHASLSPVLGKSPD